MRSHLLRRTVQQQWVLNKDPKELPRSRHFDGIAVDDGSAERLEVPRHFAVCDECRAREVDAKQRGAPSCLPRQVTLADLDKAPCASTGALVSDQARFSCSVSTYLRCDQKRRASR